MLLHKYIDKFCVKDRVSKKFKINTYQMRGRVCGTVPFGESPDQKKMSRNFKFYFHIFIFSFKELFSNTII